MQLHVLFIKRENDSDPEAVEVADDITMDENPDFIARKEKKFRSDGCRTKIVKIVVGMRLADLDKLMSGDVETTGAVDLS